MTDDVWRLTGELSKEATLRLEEKMDLTADRLGLDLPTLSYFEQKHTPLWKIEVFFVGPPSADFLDSVLEEADLIAWPHVLEAIENKDWVAETQRFLDPVSAGRFYVHGSHDPDSTTDDVVNLTVDAGQAFGTGRHETTWGCLSLLDGLEDLSPKSVLDLGTGSGLLAMAAQRLWPDSRILATDIDPVAIDVTRENLKLNACPLRPIGEDKAGIAALTADGTSDSAFRIEGPFDIIIANILAGPLISLAPSLAPLTKINGQILLSGLLQEQETEVVAAYEAVGFKREAHVHRSEWSALLMKRT